MKNHDLFKPVSQGSDGAQVEENRRIAEVADELRRLCQLYEAQFGVGNKYDAFEVEQRCVERYAKEHDCWLPMEHVFELGVPGPSGNENDTAYILYGFAGFDGRTVQPVLRQKRIANARPATQVMIDTYMAALGFTKTDREGRFTNGIYEAWDLLPRNVLIDEEGDLYVVDTEIRRL